MEQVALIVLGSVLALSTSLAVEAVRMRLVDRRMKGLLLTLLKIEIPTILNTIDRLVEDHGKLGYLPILMMNEIEAARQGYERNRDWIVLFRDEAFRRDLIEYYQQLSVVTREAQGLEGLAGQAQFGEYVVRRRPEIVARFRDVAARGRDVLQRLDRQ